MFDRIVYTRHALDRMTQRRISRDDVELTLRVGEGRSGTHGTWIYERGPYRVVIIDDGDSARVITVMRLRGRS